MIVMNTTGGWNKDSKGKESHNLPTPLIFPSLKKALSYLVTPVDGVCKNQGRQLINANKSRALVYIMI